MQRFFFLIMVLCIESHSFADSPPPTLKELLPKPEQISNNDEEEVGADKPGKSLSNKPKKKWLEPSEYSEPLDEDHPDVKAKQMGVYSFCETKTGKKIRSDEPGYPDCIEELRRAKKKA